MCLLSKLLGSTALEHGLYQIQACLGLGTFCTSHSLSLAVSCLHHVPQTACQCGSLSAEGNSLKKGMALKLGAHPDKK